MNDTTASVDQAPTLDGDMEVTVVRPKAGSAGMPGIVLLQEAFGVNDYIQDVARRLARLGYVVAAPDLFHRFDARVVGYDDRETAIGQIRSLTRAQTSMDVDAALATLHEQSGVDVGRTAVIGFCFGGRVAFEVACRRPDLAASVSFYGAGIVAPDDPDEPLRHADELSVPWLGLFGAEDPMIPLEHLRAIGDRLTQRGADHRIEVFEGAGHGFHCDARPAGYVAVAANQAWETARQFLAEHLAPEVGA